MFDHLAVAVNEYCAASAPPKKLVRGRYPRLEIVVARAGDLDFDELADG